MHRLPLIVMILLLAACGSQGPATIPPATPSSSSAGIEGRVISVSDVQTIPDIALEGTGVVVFERAALQARIEEAGREPALFMPQIEEAGLAVATTVTDGQGAYAFDVPPGDYYICLAGFDVQQVVAPFMLNGCVEAQVPADERVLLDLGWGLGGLYPY